MANGVQTYQNLVTSEYQSQPNFQATIALGVGMSVRLQFLLGLMLTKIFDLDSPPVGDQLNIIGQWVGITRNVRIPIEGVYFTWDSDNVAVGWNAGTWRSSSATGTQLVTLPDDAYLILIKAKIGANTWDGTSTSAYKIYQNAFAPFIVLIQDNCDMSYRLAIIGGTIPALTLALLTGGYIPLKPEGILISGYYASVDSGPVFSWDLNGGNFAGWGTGSWLANIAPT